MTEHKKNNNRISKRKARREKKAAEKKLLDEEVIDDPREPKLRSNIKVYRYLGPDFAWVFLGAIGCGIQGAIPNVMYLVLGGLIDSLMGNTSSVAAPKLVTSAASLRTYAIFLSKVTEAAIRMAILAAVSFAGGFLQHFSMNFAHDRFGNNLKKAYFDSLLDQEIGFFDMKRTGQLVTDLADTELIQDAYSTKLGEISKFSVQAIIGIALALRSGWKMALVMMSVGPLLAAILLTAGSLTRFFVAKTTVITGRAAAVANEVIGAMRTVRSMDGEEKEKARYVKELRNAHHWFTCKATGLGVSLGLVSFCIWGAIALGFWYGGHLVIKGEMTVGKMFTVFGLNLIAVMGLLMSLQLLPDISKASPAIRNMLKVILRDPALRPEGGVTPNKIVGHVEFKNVNFRYPTRPNVQVLKDFTLDIKPGQAVALVGASGSGKSTIVGLLERFYAAESGQIILDDVNLEEIDPRWLHRNIGIVTQEPTLFAGTIKENICYAVAGIREVTDEEIQNAAIAANAHDFILGLPKGYDTMMGERGVSLSGGQKQRVAIARAMIQNPSLLLLDEATSALDTQSESVVQDALTKLMKGRTTIVIAHRLTTIVDSDVIVVMHKGEMKEKGTHSELLNIPDGYYSRLAKKQMMMNTTAPQHVTSLTEE